MKRKIITQIGSLPYQDVKRAVKYSLKHDIPFLPELPKLGDGVLDYIKNPGKLSCLEEFKKHSFTTVKIQCIGPATLILSGHYENDAKEKVYYDENEALKRVYEHISAILDNLKAKEVILFLDEPALGQAGFNFEELWIPIFENFKVVPGVHVCGDMDWDKLLSSQIIKIISFDASKFDIAQYPNYRGDKRIAWGIEKKEDIKDFREGDLLTLPCGMGSGIYNIGDCKTRLKELKKISKKLLKN